VAAATVTPVTEEARGFADDTPLRILWRRRWIVIGTAILVTATAAVVSKTLTPIYEASARLLVVQADESQSFDAVQAAQVTARTYAEILGSPNLAADVADRLGDGTTRDDVESATSFSTIPETQLLEITAEATSAAGSKRIADTYASAFEAYARTRLEPTTKAQVRLADAAPLPDGPARPQPTLYTAFAGLLSLLLGVGLAFLRERLDTRIRNAEELERDFGLPPLARVPRRDRSREARAAFAEAFRLLRVSLSLGGEGLEAPRSVVFTSTSEGEGKTTTSLHLALAAAEAGQRVIVVEADVYRPRLRAAFGRDVNAPRGLTTYLAGEDQLDDVLEGTPIPGVQVIPAGPSSRSLLGLLEGGRGHRLLDDLHARADLVVVDCPPLAPRADATLFAARADRCVLVVDLALVNRRALTNAVRTLRSIGAQLQGCVLNRDAQTSASYYAYLADDDEPPARPPAAVAASARS
jgi:polysaccharide biosynthesis transport protein